MNLRELFSGPDDEATMAEIRACGDKLINQLMNGCDGERDQFMNSEDLHQIYKMLPRRAGSIDALFLYVTAKLHKEHGMMLVPVPIVDVNRMSGRMSTSAMVLYAVRDEQVDV